MQIKSDNANKKPTTQVKNRATHENKKRHNSNKNRRQRKQKKSQRKQKNYNATTEGLGKSLNANQF